MSFDDRVKLLNTKLGYGKVTSNILATESYGRNVFDKFDYSIIILLYVKHFLEEVKHLQ